MLCKCKVSTEAICTSQMKQFICANPQLVIFFTQFKTVCLLSLKQNWNPRGSGLPSTTSCIRNSSTELDGYLVGRQDLKKPAGTGGGSDVGVGLLREAMEGGLDLRGGARLSHPEHVVGVASRTLFVAGGRARRPASRHEREREDRLAAEEESPEFRGAKRHTVLPLLSLSRGAGVA